VRQPYRHGMVTILSDNWGGWMRESTSKEISARNVSAALAQYAKLPLWAALASNGKMLTQAKRVESGPIKAAHRRRERHQSVESALSALLCAASYASSGILCATLRSFAPQSLRVSRQP
jgi:hypothetical protein